MGGILSRSRWGGGGGGYSSQGYPTSGTPIRPGWGAPCQGVPHLRYPTHQTWPGGTPCEGYPARGYSTSGAPHQTWPGGTLLGDTPPQAPSCQTWLGGVLLGGTPPEVPPVRPGWGDPVQGVPHLRYSPSDLAWGYPAGGRYPTLHTPCQTWLGPLLGGTLPGELPHLGVPCWGYHTLGNPHQSWLRGYPAGGTPPIRPGQGVLCGEYPTLGTPSDLAGQVPCLGGMLPGGTPPQVLRQTWPGGPCPGGYPTLDTPIGPGLGVPCWVEVPHLRYPHHTWLRGYPSRGTPPQLPHPSDLARGTLWGCTLPGIPHLRYPCVRPGWWGSCPGGTPPQVPQWTWLGVPCWLEVPHLRYPCQTCLGPLLGVPCQGGTSPQVPSISSG